MARFRGEPIAIPCSPVTADRVGASTELCEAEWRTAIETTRIESYQAGLAQGEIRGRLLLASEIEATFSEPITADTAALIRQRQVH